MKVIISEQPDSIIEEVEYVKSKERQEKFNQDIKNLVDDDIAKFHGRGINRDNNRVYKIFRIEDKRVLIEDSDATEILNSLFCESGDLREVKISK